MSMPHYRGVRFDANRAGGSPWRVQIHIAGGKNLHFGYYRTARAAALVRDAEARKLGMPESVMNFPRYDIENYKVCLGCGKNNPVDHYHRGSGRLGRNPRCKDCVRLGGRRISPWNWTDSEEYREPRYDHAEIQRRIAEVRAEKIAKGHRPIGPGVVPWTPPLATKRRVHEYMSADRHDEGR